MRDQLSLDQGVLFYSWERSDTVSKCLVVPSDLQSKVLYYCHNSKDSGHLGQQKTLDKLKERFYWYRMSRDSDLTSNSVLFVIPTERGIGRIEVAWSVFMPGIPWSVSI